jgi:hypothetical protein
LGHRVNAFNQPFRHWIAQQKNDNVPDVSQVSSTVWDVNMWHHEPLDQRNQELRRNDRAVTVVPDEVNNLGHVWDVDIGLSADPAPESLIQPNVPMSQALARMENSGFPQQVRLHDVRAQSADHTAPATSDQNMVTLE